MKTWEMIKTLTEDSNKKFKTQCDNVIKMNEYGVLEWESSRNTNGGKADINILFLKNEWTEVKKPYAFEDAYKDCKINGSIFKTISDKANNATMYRTSNGEVWIDVSDGGDHLILNGKWYIED